MNLEALFAQIRTLPDEDYYRLSDEMYVIGREREARDQVEAGQAKIVAELQDAGKLDKPEAATTEQATEQPATVPAWRDPGTDPSKMYRHDDVVQHKGYIVRSTHPGLNHWEPGTLSFDGRIWEIIGTVDGADEDTAEPTQKPETAAPEPEGTGVQEWAPNLNVAPGQRYTFRGGTYEVIQGHTSASHWPPAAVPALYKKV